MVRFIFRQNNNKWLDRKNVIAEIGEDGILKSRQFKEDKEGKSIVKIEKQDVIQKIKIEKSRVPLPPFLYWIWDGKKYGCNNNCEVIELCVQRFSVGGLLFKLLKKKLARRDKK